ncbi:copper transporter [Pseudactinotalea sp.]|uniref:copper transporter n=1 Tax=Pseudactinotalea sp. TaxID=1926260 RepID=UPI003B3B35EA
MIDFRYHIVSLIAVFLALAVGVVLGAGPLQGSIGDQLTVQIEQLRQEKEELRVQLEQSQERGEELGTFVDATSQQLLEEMLTGVEVAVVETADADGAMTEALLERVAQAGGTVAGHVRLTQRWIDPADAALRDATAKDLAAQMTVPPPAETATSQVLGLVLGQALTQRDATDVDQLSEVASGFYGSLREADLVAEQQAPTAPADVVLVVAPAPVVDSDPDASYLGIQTATVTGLAGTNAVVAGTATGPGDLIAAIRANDEAAAAVSTVDSVDYVSGQITAVLALSALSRDAGPGHYGTSADAESVLPVVPELPEDDPHADAEAEPTDGTDSGDDATEEATE